MDEDHFERWINDSLSLWRRGVFRQEDVHAYSYKSGGSMLKKTNLSQTCHSQSLSVKTGWRQRKVLIVESQFCTLLTSTKSLESSAWKSVLHHRWDTRGQQFQQNSSNIMMWLRNCSFTEQSVMVHFSCFRLIFHILWSPFMSKLIIYDFFGTLSTK